MFKKTKCAISLLFVLVLLVGIGLVASGCQSGSEEEPATSGEEQVVYPQKGIDMIVVWAPGTATDSVARITAEYASAKWKVPVNVINKVGGHGIPGILEMMKAKPDGYTLCGDGGAGSTMLHASFPEVPYGVMDRTYIHKLVSYPLFFAVKADSEIKDLQGLIDYAKNNPETFKCGVGSIASNDNAAFTQLCELTGIDASKARVTFEEGHSGSISALVGGHVTAAIANPGDMKSLGGEAGKIRALAVTTRERLEEFPDIPTTRELGYEGCNVVGWFGLTGPGNLPDYVIEAWYNLMDEALQDEDFLQKVKNLGFPLDYVRGDELIDMIHEEYMLFKSILKDAE